MNISDNCKAEHFKHPDEADTQSDHISTDSSGDGEPRFKYKRILNDLQNLFTQESATCLVVNERLIAIGTCHGRIYVLDHLGNQIRKQSKKGAPSLCFAVHRQAVNDILIDNSGEYIISCSNDQRIVVMNILPECEVAQEIFVGCPVSCIGVESNFGKPSSRRTIYSGDRSLWAHDKGLLTKNKKQLYTGSDRDGIIHRISCSPSTSATLVAFVNESGLRIYDRQTDAIISFLRREVDINLRIELYPPHLRWPDDDTLICAWSNHISVCIVRNNKSDNSTLSKRFIELKYSWFYRRGYHAAGIIALNDELMTKETLSNDSNSSKLMSESILFDYDDSWRMLAVLFIYEPPEDTDSEAEPNHSDQAQTVHASLVALAPVSFDMFEEITIDEVSMRDVDTLQPHQFAMDGIASETLIYLLAPRDLIQVRPTSLDDLVDWYLENEEYEKAMLYCKQHAKNLKRHNYQTVANGFLNLLIEEGDMQAAAAIAPEVCEYHKDAWEQIVTKFERTRCARLLAPVLPVAAPQLEPECYQAVLLELLMLHDVRPFCELVAKWPSDIYHIADINQRAMQKLYSKKVEEQSYKLLMKTVGNLYAYERNYERALAIFMKLEEPEVFTIIGRFNLFSKVKDRIADLMRIDIEATLRLIVEHDDELPSAGVMRQLRGKPQLELAYLKCLFARNEGFEFSDRAVELYAEHEPLNLLAFLRRNANYSIEKALNICRQKNLIKEVVFLLGRGGNRRDALTTIITQLHDIDQAIEFCSEHDETDLWKQVVDYALKRPELLRRLLQLAGAFVDPVLIIRQIPTQLKIPGLKDSLIKVLSDYENQIRFWSDCGRISRDDCTNLMRLLLARRQQGAFVNPNDTRCAICNRLLTETPPGQQESPHIIGYDFAQLSHCAHVVHYACRLNCQDDDLHCQRCCS